jgi:dipeptidyl aminopeptidase/acylaminoacyl peptidase
MEAKSKYRSLWVASLAAIVAILMLSIAACTGKGDQSSASARFGEAKVGTAPATWPEPGPMQKIEPGIVQYEVTLPKGNVSSKLWVYLPERPGQKKLPCILIGPAGSRLFHGMFLGNGDRPEHLPYVRAGFAVIAYEVDGHMTDKADDNELTFAARAFKKADAGVANARAALDYAIAKFPAIDPDHIYAAGHSSAATLSLLVSEYEPRIKACIAYAPVCNVVGHLGDQTISSLAKMVPDFREFIENSSPDKSPAKLTCPVFLFHANDDSVVSTTQVMAFATTLKKTNPNVVVVQVSKGNHYDSMIQEGIPKGIQWLKGLSG